MTKKRKKKKGNMIASHKHFTLHEDISTCSDNFIEFRQRKTYTFKDGYRTGIYVQFIQVIY